MLVAFGRVVEHHVEDDLETGLVQRAHHGLEFGDGVVDGIARLGREPRERVVAPVVGQPTLGQELLADERLHRHQLDRRDAELLEVLDDGRLRQPEVLAAQVRRHVRDGAA